MPRPRRQTNIQLLNAAMKNSLKVSQDAEEPAMTGSGASREVKTKKRIEKQKKKEEKPINTRILLTR